MIERKTERGTFPDWWFCDECHKEKSKGYLVTLTDDIIMEFFVCEECLALARKHGIVSHGKPPT